MRSLRSGTVSIASAVLIIVAAAIAPNILQDDLEQRVAGLEARVTVLEQEVATLKGTGGAVASPSAATYTITGTITLQQDRDRPVTQYGDYCSGTGGYDDIQTGANLVILDGSGNTLGTTTLEVDELQQPTTSRTTMCVFTFEVEVPEAAFYTVKIGRRGGPTYSFADMEVNDWTMSLVIGP